MITEAEYQLFLNNHVHIALGSRVGIIDQRIIIKRSEAKNTYSNRFTELNGKRCEVFKRWAEDPDRKSCRDTWFLPTQDVLIYPQSSYRKALHWNTYIPPETRMITRDEGKVEPFIYYFELLDSTGWLLEWVASMVKEPMKRSQEVPLLVSNETHRSLFKLISILVNKAGTKFQSEYLDVKSKKDRATIYQSVFHAINISNGMTKYQINNVKGYFYPEQKFTENADQKNYTNILLTSKNEVTLPRLEREYIRIFEVSSSEEYIVLENKLALLLEDSNFLDQVFSHLKKQP